MDRKLPQNQEIERLIRASEASRSCLKDQVIELKRQLDFPARIQSSLKTHPTAWLFGSLASGFVGSVLLRRKPVAAEKKQRGLVLTLLGLALTAARPLAKVWLTDQLKGYLIGRSAAFHPNPPGVNSRS
jgi:hypothetical protein